jgi:type 1 glutamine amidotransferase
MILRTLMPYKILIVLCCFCYTCDCFAQRVKPRFSILAFYENGGRHLAFSKAAVIWLDKLAADSNFKIDYVQDTHLFTKEYLNRYQLLIQLDYVPYGWKESEQTAFRNYLQEGRGGWIGFHHATLLGNFDGYSNWDWFSEFMGGIHFKNYIPGFADGRVKIEKRDHPVVEDLPSNFTIEKEEWYTYDRSPRPHVKVIAHVDEKSYRPKSTVTMGDHPVIWTNENISARNVYIFMGHSPTLFNNTAFKKLFTNAIFWAYKYFFFQFNDGCPATISY